mmetsp:Transcript_80454/g.117941  ORF Transcript_80454/g.117941 Transcript_80454/m.117941 type:complete len:213 (+) Transcript_80454:129-767(+)
MIVVTVNNGSYNAWWQLEHDRFLFACHTREFAGNRSFHELSGAEAAALANAANDIAITLQFDAASADNKERLSRRSLFEDVSLFEQMHLGAFFEQKVHVGRFKRAQAVALAGLVGLVAHFEEPHGHLLHAFDGVECEFVLADICHELQPVHHISLHRQHQCVLLGLALKRHTVQLVTQDDAGPTTDRRPKHLGVENQVIRHYNDADFLAARC